MRSEKSKWASDYKLCRFEKLAVLFVIVAPALIVWLLS